MAESKYRSDPCSYDELVAADNIEGVYALLTNLVVEEKVLQRAKVKAATYGKEPLVEVDTIVNLLTNRGAAGSSPLALTAVVAAAAAAAAVNAVDAAGLSEQCDAKIPPSAIEAIYRDLVIPLTKQVEVEYLFKRCGRAMPDGWKERCRLPEAPEAKE